MAFRRDIPRSTERPIVKSETAARGGRMSPRVLVILVVSLALAAIAFAGAMAWWFNAFPDMRGRF